MNRTANRGRANSFIVELLLVILFFSLAAAVLLRLFAVTNGLSGDSRQMNQAVLLAQSTAERLRGGREAALALRECYPDAQDLERIPVDALGNYSVDGEYLIGITISREAGARGVLEQAKISVYAGEDCLYTLSTANYCKGVAEG